MFLTGLLATTGLVVPGCRAPLCSARAGVATMAANDWLAAQHERLPLIHLEMDELLLPGEAKKLKIEQAQALSALDAMDDNCVGCLVTTKAKNVLATSVLLEVREVRPEAIGATIDVVAVGRVQLSSISDGRYFVSHGVTPVCDVPPCETWHGPEQPLLSFPTTGDGVEREEDEEQEEETSRAREQIAACRWQLEQAAVHERRAQMREELCVLDLDLAPADSLDRLHALWGVESEADAEAQLASFAACERLSGMQRSIALSMVDTEERMQYARRCLLKTSKKAAAQLAVVDALATLKSK